MNFDDRVEEQYVIIIDTTEYAGNFEREMTAYATGIVGECEVGGSLAEDFRTDHPDYELFNDMIDQVPDDHGCRRPCKAVSHDGNKCESVAIYFTIKPTKEQLEFITNRAIEYFSLYNDKVEVLKSRLMVVTTKTTLDAAYLYELEKSP